MWMPVGEKDVLSTHGEKKKGRSKERIRKNGEEVSSFPEKEAQNPIMTKGISTNASKAKTSIKNCTGCWIKTTGGERRKTP